MISVIIPCYNQAKYLREAVESVIAQTGYKWWEIIIVDDGSTDGSYDLALQLCKEYKDISKYTNMFVVKTDDVGASNARHRGIKMARGEYYLPLDADDKISPDYFKKALPLLEANKDLGFIYVNTVYFDKVSSKIIPSLPYNFFRLIQANYISYCSLFRTSAYFDCGGYDLNNRHYFEDYQLYIKYGRRGWYGKHLAEPLFYYRVHPESSMQTERTKEMGQVYNAYIRTQYPEIYPVEWVNQAKEILKPYKEGFMSSQTPHKETIYTQWQE